jgi:hypothetical protein
MSEKIEEDERTAGRRARADIYFDGHLKKQREWYSAHAALYRNWAQALSFTIILFGGSTATLQIFKAPDLATGIPGWPVIATAVLALGIVVAEGLARIGRFQETWFAFRKASEQMKREYRLYINSAGGYGQLADEDVAYRAFVASVEQIIAEEQQLYWRSFGKSTGEPVDDK